MRLLIVDRDARYREWLRQHLGVLCPEDAITAIDPGELERRAAALTREDCDLLLLAARFGSSPEDPESEGLERLRELRGRPGFPPVLAIADDGNELTAVRALQLGAVDYLPKRLLTPGRLGTAVRLALRRAELESAAVPASALGVPDLDASDLASPELPASEFPASELAASELAAAEAPAREAPDRGMPARETPGPETLAEASPGAAQHEPIAGYTIRRKVGESEKAIVYLAESAALGIEVALKVMKRERDEASDVRDLAREHAALTAIRHPAIVRIHDYGVVRGREYLAMEYFPRGDMKARIQRGIVEPDALRYIEQIARALDVVHAASILHRDLKPPNVMLRETDEVVLIDFGLARHVHAGQGSTRKGVLRGSPYYMSPEQALGEKLDARTDLYSLGIIFYEMLTGRKPYIGTSAIEVLQQHVNGPMPRLPQQLEHLQSLLDGLLAKSPEDRFASAVQAVEAISGMRALREGGEASVEVA